MAVDGRKELTAKLEGLLAKVKELEELEREEVEGEGEGGEEEELPAYGPLGREATLTLERTCALDDHLARLQEKLRSGIDLNELRQHVEQVSEMVEALREAYFSHVTAIEKGLCSY
ncbi:unnamed protein product [Linum trigynum]|uniref:Uncharacterized protein n=1 Tax=Linum trigynum TaxID=586398 RepID=A0AAV2GIP7_9ROSI